MGKKKKFEKVTSFTYADEYGNIKTHKMTGDTGGYHARDLNQEAPAMAQVSSQTIRPLDTVKDVRTLTLDDANKNLKIADNELKVADDRYQNALSRELKKTGEDYRTRFDDTRKKQISYQTKEEDELPTKPKVIPIQEANKNLQNELNERQQAYDRWKIANYENNLAEVNAHDVNLWDKTGGRITSVLPDLASMFTVGDDRIVTDENGNKIPLPTKYDLMEQKVRQSYGDNLVGQAAKTAGDILHGATKMAATEGLNLIAPGAGSMLYWADNATDDFINNKSQGYSTEKSLANSAIDTAFQFLSGKALGGLVKQEYGVDADSRLANYLTTQINKVVSKPEVASYLARGGSEVAEEILEEWIGAMNDSLTLGKKFDPVQTFKDSVYAGIVGGGTAGLTNARQLVNTNVNNQIQAVRPQNLAQTVETQPTSTNLQTEQNAPQMAENAPITEPQVNQQETTETRNNNLSEKEFNEISRRYKTLLEDTGMDVDFYNKNATPEEMLGTIKSIKEMYEDDGFLEQARWESQEVRQRTRNEYNKIKRFINRFENIVNKEQKATQSNLSEQNTQPVLQTNQQQTQQGKSNQNELIKEIRQEVEEQTNKTMSKHIETSSKATGTVEDVRNMDYDDIVYNKETHKSSEEQALRELAGKDTDTNVNDVHAKFRGTERLTNVDSAKITELMKQTKSLAEEASKNGNDSEYNKRMEQFRTLKGDYAVALSESGQFTEYAKVIKELDPDTQVDVLNKVIEREQRRGNKKYKDVTLNKDLVEKYKKAKTDQERDVIMEEIKDDTARQLKITLTDKANEFRFLSMLGNLKTHGRNLIGNAGMYSLQSFKDGVAAIGEDIYNKASKNGLETRTKTLKPATKEVSNFVNNKVDSFMKDLDSKYNENRGIKGDLERRTKKFSDKNIIGKALNKASDINSKALDKSDKFFSSKMTKQAMKGFLTANGIETDADIEAHPELVAQALDYALFKGKEATFHQDSTTATAIRNLRDKLYTGSGFSKLGGLAIDASLPFVSTPANIAKTALEYTPIVGFGDINKQFQNAPDNMKANVFIDSLSKQFAGGALMAVGAYLASKGLVKGSGDDDKEDKTEASLGNASYSVKIGNSTYDLSWLSPTAIPFFEGVEVFNAFKKANSKGGIKATDTADLIDTMFGTLNPMTDMSVLQSVERIITSIAYGGNAVKSATSTAFSSYLQQYIPTFLSQIAQAGDTKQRNTNTGSNVIEKTIDQIKYKIPGKHFRESLPEKTDVWGNTNKTADNLGQRAIEAFLSPANRKDYKVDKTTKELERLARETDDTSMLPTVKDKSVRINKKDYDLKGKDYVDLQKTYGKTAKKNLDELIKSDAYKNASDVDKQSMVRKLYDYASYKAKENYAKNKGINFDSGNQTAYAMVDAFDIPYEKYVENKVSGNDSASKMISKLNEAGLSEAQKGAVMNYFNRAYYVNEDDLYDVLENSDLSEKQKDLIRAKYEKNITDSERERYQRADNIGVDYDLYTKFRSFVSDAKGESRSGGLTKKQKVINWIQDQELTAQQKKNLYNDYINNQGIFQYYK